MDDFKTFKASRQKIDPTTRHFSEGQWEEAYSAYKQSRKRLIKGQNSGSRSSSRRRKNASSDRSEKSAADDSSRSDERREASDEAAHYRSPGRLASKLGAEIRRDSAYRDLRVVFDVLAWVAITLIALSVTVKWFYDSDVSVALDAGISGAVQAILVYLLRLLIHVIIDIPDIALHKRVSELMDKQ